MTAVPTPPFEKEPETPFSPPSRPSLFSEVFESSILDAATEMEDPESWLIEQIMASPGANAPFVSGS
jgi:hypothetical protein